jgi:hypothetical protein
MKRKKNRYVVKAVKKMIKLRDLKCKKDAHGGVAGPSAQQRPEPLGVFQN